MKWFSQKVKVTFIDGVPGKPFTRTDMSPGDLPESFELHTTLNIGSDGWIAGRDG